MTNVEHLNITLWYCSGAFLTLFFIYFFKLKKKTYEYHILIKHEIFVDYYFNNCFNINFDVCVHVVMETMVKMWTMVKVCTASRFLYTNGAGCGACYQVRTYLFHFYRQYNYISSVLSFRWHDILHALSRCLLKLSPFNISVKV